MKSKCAKRIANIIVLCLFVMSTVLILKCSDLPNVFNLSFMERPKQNADILMSISTSFFVTGVFYFFMNYIPDKISEREKFENELPKRKLVHREVQFCIIRLVDMWKDIIEMARKRDNSIPAPQSVEKIFQTECIVDSANITVLSEVSHKMSYQMDGILWQYSISEDIELFCNCATNILRYYYDYLPGSVTYDLFYLLNESFIAGRLSKSMDIFIQLNGTNEISLSACIPQNFELEKSRQAILEICGWVNSEYDVLQQILDIGEKDNIYKIGIALN